MILILSLSAYVHVTHWAKFFEPINIDTLQHAFTLGFGIVLPPGNQLVTISLTTILINSYLGAEGSDMAIPVYFPSTKKYSVLMVQV